MNTYILKEISNLFFNLNDNKKVNFLITIFVIVSFSAKSQDSYVIVEERYKILEDGSLLDSLIEKQLKYYNKHDSLTRIEKYKDFKIDELTEYCYCNFLENQEYKFKLCSEATELVETYDELDSEIFNFTVIKYSSDFTSFINRVIGYNKEGTLIVTYHFNSSGNLVTKSIKEWCDNKEFFKLYEIGPNGEFILMD